MGQYHNGKIEAPNTHAVICTYNGEEYIGEQLISIIKQSVSINQIHVYDFNSNDKTLSEIKKISKQFPSANIKLTNCKHYGSVGESFQYAIRDVYVYLTENSIVYICDQDDYWFKDKNKYILQHFPSKNKEPKLIHHDVEITDKNLNPIEKEFYSFYQKIILRKKINHRLIFNTVIGHSICLNFKAIGILKNQDYNSAIIMHDWYWGSILEQLGIVLFLDKKLSYYRQHERNFVGANLYKKTWKISLMNFCSLALRISEQYQIINSRIQIQQNWIQLIYHMFKYKNMKGLCLLLTVYFMNLRKNIYE